MSALLSFRNDVVSVECAAGTTVIGGSLDNLRTRQLERGVSIQATGFGQLPELIITVPAPFFGTLPPGPEQAWLSRGGARVIGLLGLPVLKQDLGASFFPWPRIALFGLRWDVSAGAMVEDLLDEASPWRDPDIDGEFGLANRVMAFPAPGGDGLAYRQYKLQVLLSGPTRIGRIWIGNAVELDKGVDADWSWGVQSAGTVAASRGGQAYANPAPSLRTLAASFSGGGLNARLAFGLGVTVPSTGIRRTSDWLSDAATHMGSTGNCILIPRTDPFWVQRTAIYGRLNSEPLRIDHLAGDHYRARAEVIEER